MSNKKPAEAGGKLSRTYSAILNMEVKCQAVYELHSIAPGRPYCSWHKIRYIYYVPVNTRVNVHSLNELRDYAVYRISI
jgi:hypothetical protein